MAVQKFTKEDLKVGYVVELRNGEFRMVMPAGSIKGDATLILAGAPNQSWDYLSRWDNNLYASSKKFECCNGIPGITGIEYGKKYDVMAVYGYVSGTKNYNHCGDLSAEHRPILWGRVAPKKMTVAEIEEKLGYPIEIISED